MIRVTIELVPYGEEHLKQTIAEALIANDGNGTHETGFYTAILRERRTDQKSNPPFYYNPDGRIVQAKSHVDHFPRLELGAWDLLEYVLENRSRFERTDYPSVKMDRVVFGR